jgi:hypothetical protein
MNGDRGAKQDAKRQANKSAIWQDHVFSVRYALSKGNQFAGRLKTGRRLARFESGRSAELNVRGVA